MTSFQITLTPSRRAAARFVAEVTRALQKAYAEEKQKRGLTQSEIARSIGVHRSIINRQLRGQRDMSLSRVAELTAAMGRKPSFLCAEPTPPQASRNSAAEGSWLEEAKTQDLSAILQSSADNNWTSNSGDGALTGTNG